MADTSKKLVRSTSNAVLGGVCGGLAEYFEVDATLVRVAAIIVAFLLGGLGGVLLYIVLWVVIPAAPHATAADDVPVPDAKAWAEEQTVDVPDVASESDEPIEGDDGVS